MQATFGVSDGASLWAVRYSTEGRARSLFASADVDAIRRLHPDNPRFQRLGADDRLIVSEPFSDLPGVWQEIPEATAVTVRDGGVLEERPFRVRPSRHDRRSGLRSRSTAASARQLERAVLPLATSVDGRRFRFQTTLHGLELEAGGYVMLEGDGSTRLGQVLSLELRQRGRHRPGPAAGADPRRRGARAWCWRGTGGRSTTRPCGPRSRTRWRVARPDPPRPRAPSRSGSWRWRTACRSSSTRAASGATRSSAASRAPGKTYSLGVLLERLLMETEPARRGARSELGLRAARRAARGRGSAGARSASRRRGRLGRGAQRRGRPCRDPGALPRAEPGAAGGACCGSTRSPTARSTRS